MEPKILPYLLIPNKNLFKNLTECGGLIEGTSGVIQSPGYPNGYPHRHICRWDIVGPPGRSVKLEFDGTQWSTFRRKHA